MSDAVYIHGTDPEEQARLAKLGELTNQPFLEFLEFSPTDAILDVGCGLGILTRRLAQLATAGTVWGIERSTDQLGKAVRDLPNLHFLEGDAQALPFDDNSFDMVFCRYLLEHVANPGQVLKEMHRVLKSGGKVFVQENNILINVFDPPCPHFDALWRQFARLQEIHGGDALIGKKLFRLLRMAGFADIRLSIQPEVHCHGMPTFRPWVENLMQNVRPAEGQLIEKGLATAEDIALAKQELADLAANEAGSAYFYWNRARAVKSAQKA
jgi:ubiquinone/menaquinone biosynthesis C-methylase UbiE